jgi:DNA polymerase III subunit epsilon
MNQQTQDRNAAIMWARSIVDRSHEYYILDTETTRLNNPEVIELAVIDLDGKMMINQRFRPLTAIEPGATDIHGLTNEMLATQPQWPIVGASLGKDIFQRKILIYNFPFDYRAIDGTYILHDIPFPGFSGECVMRWYSQFIGDWDARRRSYRWQKLPSGDHSALGDCIATLKIINLMAGSETVGLEPFVSARISLPEAIEYGKEILRQ